MESPDVSRLTWLRSAIDGNNSTVKERHVCGLGSHGAMELVQLLEPSSAGFARVRPSPLPIHCPKGHHKLLLIERKKTFCTSNS